MKPLDHSLQQVGIKGGRGGGATPLSPKKRGPLSPTLSSEALSNLTI
jgi:hypothetical protein